MKFLKYNTYVVSVTRTKSVILDDLCNGYVVRNAGNTILVFRNEPLDPGESKTIGGNFGEVCMDRVDIAFMDQAVQPLPRVNQGFVTQKVYLPGGGFDHPTL